VVNVEGTGPFVSVTKMTFIPSSTSKVRAVRRQGNQEKSGESNCRRENVSDSSYRTGSSSNKTRVYKMKEAAPWAILFALRRVVWKVVWNRGDHPNDPQVRARKASTSRSTETSRLSTLKDPTPSSCSPQSGWPPFRSYMVADTIVVTPGLSQITETTLIELWATNTIGLQPHLCPLPVPRACQ